MGNLETWAPIVPENKNRLHNETRERLDAEGRINHFAYSEEEAFAIRQHNHNKMNAYNRQQKKRDFASHEAAREPLFNVLTQN
jgi:hypothetical protein